KRTLLFLPSRRCRRVSRCYSQDGERGGHAANRRRGNSCENPGASAAAHRCHHTQVHAGVAAVSAGFDNTTAAADPTSLTTLLTPALNRKGEIHLRSSDLHLPRMCRCP